MGERGRGYGEGGRQNKDKNHKAHFRTHTLSHSNHLTQDRHTMAIDSVTRLHTGPPQ